MIGCLDVPGSTRLKASNRELKKKLFDECGMAYAVLNVSPLPTSQALRAAFLGELALAHIPGYDFAISSQCPFCNQPISIHTLRLPQPACCPRLCGGWLVPVLAVQSLGAR